MGIVLKTVSIVGLALIMSGVFVAQWKKGQVSQTLFSEEEPLENAVDLSPDVLTGSKNGSWE